MPLRRRDRSRSRPARIAVLAGCAAALAACSQPLPVSHFAGTAPAFDPVAFFTGHTVSWGVLEDRSGQPTGIVTNDCRGVADGADGVRMVQRLTLPDGRVQTRDWRLLRTGPHRYRGTADDMVGSADGEAQGRVFHWRWVLATKPGDGLRNVVMDQWMYAEADGAMVNRTTIRKLGVILAEVTEQFERRP